MRNVKNNNEKEFLNVEQEFFKALDHQTRRDIVKYIGEKESTTFSDLLDAVKIPDSPTLSYHLKTLELFIEQHDGIYQLTSLGKDAYDLLQKTTSYSKLISHVGMIMTKEEDEKWHQEHREMTPDQHKAFMKKMGISEEEDMEWHRTHDIPQTSRKQDLKPLSPFAIGGGFLDYCIKQGWVIQEGKGKNAKYYMTEEGKKELKNFGIILEN